MNKDILRLLELSGQKEKSITVSKLYEGYKVNPAADEDGMDAIKGLEGPFRMKNGRVVYYDPKEGKYYDRRTDMYLSREEAAALHEAGTQFNEGVILHATGEDKSISLRLEAMLGMLQVASVLHNNGYDNFEVTDADGKRAPIKVDDLYKVVEESDSPDVENVYEMSKNERKPNEKESREMIKDCITQHLKRMPYTTAVSQSYELSMTYFVDSGFYDLDTFQGMFDEVVDDIGDVDGEHPLDYQHRLKSEGVAKGRPSDLKHTGGLSQATNQSEKKALKAKERQQGKEAAKVTEGDKSDYSSWKESVSKKHGSEKISFFGDEKDLAGATVTVDGKKKSVGTWDGTKGVVHESAQDIVEATKPSAELISNAADKLKSKLVGDKVDPKAGIRREPTKPNATTKVVDSSRDVVEGEDETAPAFAKGDSVMYKDSKKVVVVADGPANMVGISDKADGKVDMVKSCDLTKATTSVEEAAARIMELSKGTLRNYIDKATTSQMYKDEDNADRDHRRGRGSVAKTKQPQHYRDSKQTREKGIGAASVKVARKDREDMRARANEGNVSEAMMASPANLFINSDLPANAVDDADLKGERTGQKDRTTVKNKVPKEVIGAIKKRVAEIKKSIERYDDKGYNDLSVKENAVDALEQISDNLARGDHEGFMEAQMFFLTLMSPIWDLFPAQVVNYLAKGSE
jgi:hypothetical protein